MAYEDRLKDFVGVHGSVHYRNGTFFSDRIRTFFTLITKEDGLIPGDLVWVHKEAVDGKADVSGFTLCRTSWTKIPLPKPGVPVFRVPNEANLLELIKDDPRMYQRA